MSAEKKPAITKRFRYFTRRHAILVATIAGIIALVVIVLAMFLVRLGFVDRYVAGQIKQTSASYGIRAEVGEFHATVLPPRAGEMAGVALYAATTNARIGKTDPLCPTIKVEDLYALNLQRNINLQALRMEGLALWVRF